MTAKITHSHPCFPTWVLTLADLDHLKNGTTHVRVAFGTDSGCHWSTLRSNRTPRPWKHYVDC